MRGMTMRGRRMDNEGHDNEGQEEGQDGQKDNAEEGHAISHKKKNKHYTNTNIHFLA
jgi:hypothetical protein